MPLLALRRGIEHALASLDPVDGSKTVLDFGCGDRPYEPLIRARGFDYLGGDLDGNPDILVQPGTPLTRTDASCAGVVSFQVLEHVWDTDWYLGECHRVIEPGGWLLLSTHGVWPYHPHPTDYRRWTGEGLRRELEKHRFDVVSVTGLLGPLAWTTQVRALGIRHALLGIPIVRGLTPLIIAIMNLRMALEERVTPDRIRQDNACIYVVLCRRPRSLARDPSA
jgi:SAM-dependent methyltransferase